MRRAYIERKTAETDIRLELTLEGDGYENDTGCWTCLRSTAAWACG